MIVGIGIDVVLVTRFEQQLRKAPALRERLFVPAERELNTRSLAARFAAKEAVAKALGAPAGMNWQDCQVVMDSAGTPQVEIGRDGGRRRPGEGCEALAPLALP